MAARDIAQLRAMLIFVALNWHAVSAYVCSSSSASS
jgi:hypothetical protein